jgi:hypothetical protein
VTLLRDLIDIPTSVGEADFVVRASGDADLDRYVVTDDLRRNFGEALGYLAGGREVGDSYGTAAAHHRPR